MILSFTPTLTIERIVVHIKMLVLSTVNLLFIEWDAVGCQFVFAVLWWHNKTFVKSTCIKQLHKWYIKVTVQSQKETKFRQIYMLKKAKNRLSLRFFVEITASALFLTLCERRVYIQPLFTETLYIALSLLSTRGQLTSIIPNISVNKAIQVLWKLSRHR